MLDKYKSDAEKRKEAGVDPKPLSKEQVVDLTKLLINPDGVDENIIVDLFVNRIPPGVDDASKVKAQFLNDVGTGNKTSPLISRKEAVNLLGTMLGGFNVKPLIDFLDDETLAPYAATALSETLLVFDNSDKIFKKSKTNKFAKNVIDSWAEATWFTKKDELPESYTVTVFKVDGEINTDDFSPAADAWSRPDIPLHAQTMLKSRIEKPLEKIVELKKKGNPIAFVGDVVGTGSSRKSATNSLLWHIGNDIPFVPNKRQGGIVIGGNIAPIFFNTLEDAGALPIECDVTNIKNGDVLTIYPFEGKIVNTESGNLVTQFSLKTEVLLDEVRAGGRISLITGRSLTAEIRKKLDLEKSTIFKDAKIPENSGKGFTLAQKIVGKACGIEGVRPGAYCEPVITTVGSQDTTGPMTRDELKELACLSFSSDLVMQSFCHTAAYPKPVDIEMHKSMPDFFTERGGVALKPGDGIIHSWLNRMILPDTVGTGGDSHTRFPIGISFPAGSGLVAFGAAMGIMPLDMPESVLVKFKGDLQPGITLRDLVNSIPYFAIKKDLLTVEKEGKKNIFSGRILEIEGLDHLSVEEAFELTDASAERSAAASTIKLSPESVSTFLKSNITVLQSLIDDGYSDQETLKNRIKSMEAWVDKPELLVADSDAEYEVVIEIDLNDIKEPVLACPNDPDDVRLLSEVEGVEIEEVFIGSCMTNINHYRAAADLLEGKKDLPVRLWIAPATRIDQEELRNEGAYSIFGKAGARMEIPGCSLCMGNQARVFDNAKVISTSTRNFPNRIGDDADVYLGSAELSVICAILGKIPSLEEYQSFFQEK